MVRSAKKNGWNDGALHGGTGQVQNVGLSSVPEKKGEGLHVADQKNVRWQTIVDGHVNV